MGFAKTLNPSYGFFIFFRTNLLALSPNLRGSLLMAVAMACFSITDAISKFLTAQMNFGEVILLRGIVACVLVGALVTHQRALRPLRTLFVTPVALRICGEIGGTVLFLAAIAHLPLANVSAIIQALPLAITLWRGSDPRRTGRMAPLARHRRRLLRRADHRAAGRRWL
jgi:drug/metabolite transporter (DMT)-like permease